MKKPGRIDNARWRAARAAVLRDAIMCALCGYPLRPDAPPRSKWHTEVDHIVPLYMGGDPYSLSNLRACHKTCNCRRPKPGIKQQTPLHLRRSRQW